MLSFARLSGDGDMRQVLVVVAMAFACILAAPGAGRADNYLIGSWTYGGCTLHLKGADALGHYAAETNFCSGEWAFVTNWRPFGSGVELLTTLNKSVARLGLANGNLEVRLDSGKLISFRRTTPVPGNARPPVTAGSGSVPVFKPHPFVGGIPCVKRGSSETCASAYDLGLPRDLPRNSTQYTKAVNVTVFTGLNFRAKIGFDQPVFFTIQSGLCIPIWACFDTKDSGPWCVTQLNGKQGYIAKFSKRGDGKTMQVNFGNGCSG
jgi:hypothetical protein